MTWSQDFCLACDRQTDGSTYCGESCRLAEYERANSVSGCSGASSPIQQHLQLSWSSSSSSTFNFASASQSQSSATAKSTLTPSSSQASLVSLQSNSSSASIESTPLSEAARRELKAYASAFDQSRNHRRQSQ